MPQQIFFSTFFFTPLLSLLHEAVSMATSSSFLAHKSGNLQEVRAASRQLAAGRLEDGVCGRGEEEEEELGFGEQRWPPVSKRQADARSL